MENVYIWNKEKKKVFPDTKSHPMRSKLCILIFFVLLGINMVAQQRGENSLVIDWNAGGGQVKGNISEGVFLDDLSWAWNSSVACFPATQSSKFRGKHVWYSFEIPTRTEVEIKVIPQDQTANFSLYAYMTGLSNASLPPDISSCIRCESDYKWDMPWKGKTQDHTRLVRHILSIQKPYRVVVGVVGEEGTQEADFILQVLKK